MGEQKNAWLERHQLEQIDKMVKDGVADNDSEAVRTALDAGLAELGYLSGNGSARTRLRWAVRELARLFTYLGLGWLAATLLFPVEFRLYAVGWFVVALAFLGADRVLADVEPWVSRRLIGLVGGETA